MDFVGLSPRTGGSSVCGASYLKVSRRNHVFELTAAHCVCLDRLWTCKVRGWVPRCRHARGSAKEQKRAVVFSGWVFYLISLGGQAPHVLRAHVWALNTRGEPNEIEWTIRVLTGCSTAPFCRPFGRPPVHQLLRARQRGETSLSHPEGEEPFLSAHLQW